MSRIRAALRTACPDWVVSEIASFDYLSGGLSNANYRFGYRGQSYVLRVPTRADPYVDRAREGDVYDAFGRDDPDPAKQRRFRPPGLVAFDAGSGVMVTRFEEGELLADAPPLENRLIARLQSFHDQLPATAAVYDPLARARAGLATGSAPAWIASLANTEWRPPRRTACHNDLNPWNVIEDGAGWVVLDWEWHGQNDPLFDIVTIHQGLGLDAARLEAVAVEALEESIDSARLVACVAGYWLREYAWAFAARAAGDDRDAIEEQLVNAREHLREHAS